MLPFVLASRSPRALDALTAEKTIRGQEVEGPVDTATALVLTGGSAIAGAAFLRIRLQRGQWRWFWLGYAVLLLVCAAEESDWLHVLLNHNADVFGNHIGSLHDLVSKVTSRSRAGAPDYVASAPLIWAGLTLLLMLLGYALWRVQRSTPGLDWDVIGLMLLGVLLGTIGLLIDADVLPKPSGIEWKAHIEEPLEAVGALSLALASMEGFIRIRGESGPRVVHERR